MDILVAMGIGVLLGRFIVPSRFKRALELAQTVCTGLLILTMGISLGHDDSLLASVGTLGIQGLLFCLLPTGCSIACVYVLTERLMPGARTESDAGARAERYTLAWEADGEADARSNASAGKGSASPLKLFVAAFAEPLVIVAFVALAMGVAAGIWCRGVAAFDALVAASDAILYLLMALVGMSVGAHRGLLASIRRDHVKTLVIPLGVMAGSLVGGAVASLICGFTVRSGMAVASGLGWYSLAGVTIEGMAGAQLGAVAFLSSLMRELFSFFLIPLIARHLNYYACIAAAGATSEDTTLPMMIRYTDERCVVFSLVNGIICSTFVPILITVLLS